MVKDFLNRIRYKMKYKDEDFAYEYIIKGRYTKPIRTKTFDDKICI